jgi:serine/threonine-protein kinase HipA
VKGSLNVWWNQRLVGQLTQDRHGEFGFVYSPIWLAHEANSSISASLPKRIEPFTRRECRPFFGGLLPEQSQREIAAQALGVSAANDYALLDKLGGDVAGALQLLPQGQQPRPTPRVFRPQLLDEAALLGVLNALPTRPLLAGASGLRLSLAGAQSKVPIVLVGKAVALPDVDQPTTHILKPPIERFSATTENEAFVMRLASAIGLEVAAVEPRIVRERKFLLIKRYDRKSSKRLVQRIHQEDLCQALGVAPEKKYASEGGPTFADCFALVRRLSERPALDVLKLLDAAIFNLIVGNADAHAKNFSILYTDEGARLAPLYDLLATVAYKALSPKLAMKIGKQSTLKTLKLIHWAAFAAEAGVSLPLVRRRVEELAEQVQAASPRVATGLLVPGFDEAALMRFSKLAIERAQMSVLTLRR